jgi:CIC family chloride channel protein
MTEALEGLTDLLRGDLAGALDDLAGRWTIILVPAVVAIPVVFLITKFSREARTLGVPEVMYAVETRGGRIRPIVPLIKGVTAALTIGAGGSAGREGPIVAIGAGVASGIARMTRQTPEMMTLMVAAGAAGGIAATFNAPIAGLFFALEVVLRRFNVRNFTVVVISAVIANMIAIALEGDNPGIAIPTYELVSATELGLYPILGIAAAIVGVAFMRVLYLVEDGFALLPLTSYGRAIVGLLAVGALGLWHEEIFGVGFGAIEVAAGGGDSSVAAFGAGTLALLIVLKIFATSFTLGGGASGGVFAPSLFMGAMLGSLLGSGFNELFPGAIAPDGAFAVVGMAALFAAAARAPITALFIVFEMTRDYSLILPLMVGVATATAVAQIMTRDTIYSIKLHRIGFDINDEDEEQPMDRVTVSEAMTTNVSLVQSDTDLEQMAVAMARSRGNVLAVTDEHGGFQGLVSATDLTAALDRNDESVTAADIAVQSPIRVYPDDTLRSVVSLLAENDVRQVPVVARWNEQRLLGMMTQRDVLREFARRGSRRTNVPRKPPPVRRLVGAVQVELSVDPASHLVGVELRNVPLPQEAVITTIHRDGVVVIPRGTVTLEAGDLLTILSEPAVEQAVRRLLAAEVEQTDADRDSEGR